MKNALVNIVFLTLVIFLGLASLYGESVAENTPVKQVGAMQLSSFKNGLSLYQVNRNYYYAFSPYNDYFIKDGQRSAFFSPEEIKENRFSTNLHASHFKDIQNSIGSFFGISNPEIKYSSSTFSSKSGNSLDKTGEEVLDKEIEYKTKVDGNTLSVLRKVRLNEILHFVQDDKLVLGQTFSYYGIEFIFDKEGNLYNFKEASELFDFTSFYGLNLKPDQEIDFSISKIKVEGKAVAISNPYLSSTIVIRADDNQSLYVNRQARLIEIEEVIGPDENGYYKSEARVEIYESPKEALDFL